eukprot:2205481-Amphidinium_carterae.1
MEFCARSLLRTVQLCWKTLVSELCHLCHTHTHTQHAMCHSIKNGAAFKAPAIPKGALTEPI